MKAENHQERKKRIYQFGALYLGALVLIALAFAFLGGQQAAGPGGENFTVGLGSQTKDTWANRANGILLKNMKILQRLDDQVDRLSEDPAGRDRLAGADKMIGLAETTFKNEIDSLERQGSEYALFTAACRTLLDNRRTLSNFRAALATGQHWPGAEQQDLLRLQQQLALKDKELFALQDRPNRSNNSILPEDKQAAAAASSQVMVNLRNDNRSLQTALDEQRKNNEGLREMIISLRRSNESLNTRLTESGKQTGGSDRDAGSLMMAGGGNTTAAGGKRGAAEQRTAELIAELSFAQVDCNLTRADAKQTIYNSRQRKDLLTDALTVLTELSKSDDGAVQQKAREKLVRLRNIAAAIHD